MTQSSSLLFAFSTLGVPEAGWEELAALATANGFQGVELRALRGSVDLPHALQQEFGSPENFARVINESGIRIVSLDSSMRLHRPEESHKNEVAELLDWAQAAAIPFIRIFDGGEVGSGKDPEVRAGMLSELDFWHRLKEQKGYTCDLMVETHWAIADPQDARKLAEESGGRLHLLWDVCHTWFHAGADLPETWHLLKKWVRHIHIKDATRDTTSAHGLRYALPGEGQLEIPALLHELVRDGFPGTVSLEWEKLWHPELPPLEDALQSGREHGWW